MDLLGFAVLFVGLLVIGATQGGVAIGIMFLMHKKIADQLPEKTYGPFSFDHYEKPVLLDFLARVAIIFVGTTFVLHMLEYIFVTRNLAVRHRAVVLFVLFVLETAAIGVGLFKLFHLDVLRLVILTTSSAIIYLFFLWFMQAKQLLL